MVEKSPVFLEASDDCYYARDYISSGGFESSETNQLISNFKKTIIAKGTTQWRYKQAAVQQFPTELLEMPSASSSVPLFMVAATVLWMGCVI